MPARNGTGPAGSGSLTGRGLGTCGRKFAFRGCGRGFGRRFDYRSLAPQSGLSKEEKLKILKAEKEDIDKAIKELEE